MSVVTYIITSVAVLLALLVWHSRRDERAKAKRGWNDPRADINILHFILEDGKVLTTVERGNKVEEILEDMVVMVGGVPMYRMTYVNSRPGSTMEPRNFEGTPWLAAVVPVMQVKHVWMQMEAKR